MLNRSEQSLAIVIPALNVAETIGPLCQRLNKFCPHVIVVDDGSTDDTSSAARKAGAHVIRHDTRRGKGSALRTGFAHALTSEVEWVGMLDGDGQHLAQDFLSLYFQTLRRDPDMIIGERSLSSQQMPFVRRITNRTMTGILNAMTKTAIEDSQSGMRIIRAASLRNMNLRTRHYEIESEMILRAASLNLRVVTAPIDAHYPEKGRSYIHPLVDTYRWLKLLARWFLTQDQYQRESETNFAPAA